MYPKGTEMIYSNMTPRSASRSEHIRSDDGCPETVVFAGLQGFIKWFLIDCWNQEFFSQPKDEVVAKYKRRMDAALGPDSVSMARFEALHDLGYMPIEIKALPEGSLVPMRVPVYTIKNTHPDFFWLTNYLETSLSCETWKTITSATTAFEYYKILRKYAELTGVHPDFVKWQAHDFSERGLSGLHDASQSGLGHLISFFGTDTIAAIDYAENFYGADAEKEMVGGSVPASEHSVICAGGNENEVETIRRLITEVTPSGIVSVVSDTWDFWKVITITAHELKEVILNRPVNALGMAKVVFRPDSGDPVKILCGHKVWNTSIDGSLEVYSNVVKFWENCYEAVKNRGIYHTASALGDYEDDSLVMTYGRQISVPEAVGAVECLWGIFGGTITDKGFKQLHERVGLIYGDSITVSRAEEICAILAGKGFSSGNSVYGVGSFSYQFVTRDSYGMAVKATAAIVDGEFRELFKDPKTDDGMKKSAKGLLRVEREDGKYVLYDQQTWEQEAQGCLEVVFKDGVLVKEQTLAQIRGRLMEEYDGIQA
jgi:nicotinamide phosphoribosyltransferase